MLTLATATSAAHLAGPLTALHTAIVPPVRGSLAAVQQAALTRLPLEVAITPNSKLPGTAQLTTLVGGLVTWVLLACVGAVLLGAAAWGIGSRSGYYGAQQNGRMMVLGGAVGAMVAGAAAALVNFGFGIGSAVQ